MVTYDCFKVYSSFSRIFDTFHKEHTDRRRFVFIFDEGQFCEDAFYLGFSTIFISNEEELQEHIKNCPDCKKEYEKHKNISNLVKEVAPVYLAKKAKEKSTFIKNEMIPLQNILIGLIVAIILTFISFTTPIGITLICLYIIAMVLSTAIGVVVIATKVLQDKETDTKNVLLYTLIASAVVSLVKFIPVIGGLVGFVLSMVGVGTLYNVIFGKEKETPIKPTEQTEAIQQ